MTKNSNHQAASQNQTFHEDNLIGIIGGTGLYSLDGLKVDSTTNVETPYGNPSAPITLGTWDSGTRGKPALKVAFLPRHGSNHSVLPSEINFRANIWALKSVGVRTIISVSATGSLKQKIEPGHLALPTQYLDFTKGLRKHTFFGDGIVAHISSARPVCERNSEKLAKLAAELSLPHHTRATYACVEGPRLGARAESFFLRQLGCDVVGMTNVPEAFLAREAQICYTPIAVATDYDCWHEDPHLHVTAEMVLKLYQQSIHKVKALIGAFLSSDQTSASGLHQPDCTCRRALQGAVMTHRETLSPEHQKRLDFLMK